MQFVYLLWLITRLVSNHPGTRVVSIVDFATDISFRDYKCAAASVCYSELINDIKVA